MNRGAWWVMCHDDAKELDMTWRLNNKING